MLILFRLVLIKALSVFLLLVVYFLQYSFWPKRVALDLKFQKAREDLFYRLIHNLSQKILDMPQV